MAHEPQPATGSDRRSALKWLTALLGAAASAALALPLVGYVLGSFLKKEAARADQWIDLGPVDSFPLKGTRLTDFLNPHRHPWDGLTAKSACYVRRTGEETFLVFAVNCAHLGCPVSWFPTSGLFLCPCHGGVYYEDGARASGPPPRGLFRYDWRVAEGHLWIVGGHLPTLQDPADAKDRA